MQSKIIKWGASERNKGPILNIITPYIQDLLHEYNLINENIKNNNNETTEPNQYPTILEIGSGPGAHMEHICTTFPQIGYQPSDVEETYFESIHAHIQQNELNKTNEPMIINALTFDDEVSSIYPVDIVLCINVVHISPWAVTEGIFRIGRRNLSNLQQSGIVLYGPYRRDGQMTESNEKFHRSLRERNQEWGIRDLEEVEKVASEYGFILNDIHQMPANNLLLMFKRN